MERCVGGDLSVIIKQAMKQNRLVPEDTIWRHSFQILQALRHCYHLNGHGRSGAPNKFQFHITTSNPAPVRLRLQPEPSFL